MDNGFHFDETTLERINRFTRRPVTEDEVYAFPLVLCDNEIDRDGERFSAEALEKLSGLFLGKTGIFDHDARSSGQTARICFCEVRRDENRLTACSEVYTYLYAEAYMMRTERSRDLITEIEGGIKKEVSVSCSVGRRVCSVCGRDRREDPCGHIKGRRYEGSICCDILEEPSDAYEWSFVAIPAQTEAGVTKRFSESPRDQSELAAVMKQLEREREISSLACDMLRREIMALSFTVKPIMAVETVKALTDRLDFDELCAMRDRLKAMSFNAVPDAGELFMPRPELAAPDNGRFKV